MADFLQDLNCDTLQSLAAEGMLSSFRFSYIIAGDIVYMPHGIIVCEKAVGANNVSMRVPSMLCTKNDLLSLAFIRKVYPMCLGEIKTMKCKFKFKVQIPNNIHIL